MARAAAGLFGQIGAPIALGALLLVGVVIAANRTIADLWKPVWRQRPAIGGLKPGTIIPDGTATRFERFFDDDEEPAETDRHIPEPNRPRGRQVRLIPNLFTRRGPPGLRPGPRRAGALGS